MKEEFIEKYKALFEELSKVDKGDRIAYVKKNSTYMHLMEDSIALVPSVNLSAENSLAEEYYKKIPKNFDGIVFMEVFVDAIKYFEGDIENFISFIIDKYIKRSRVAGGAKAYDERYIGKTGLSIKKKNALKKLCVCIERYHTQYGGSSKEAYAYIIDCIEKGELQESEAGLNYLSKKDIEYAMEIALVTKGMISLDKGIDSDEEGETTLAEIIASGENRIDELIDTIDGKVTVLDLMIENWGTLVEGYGNRHRDFLKAIFSQGILDQLKRKEENGIRVPYKEEPAGDGAFYDYLQTRENELVTEVLHWIYINSAFDEDPMRNLENVYEWLLKQGFKFNDNQLAFSLGVQPANVSKKKRRFKDTIPPLIEILLKEKASYI